MYTLHIANKNYSSWSLRPWLVLKTLDIPFTEDHPSLRPAWRPGYETFSPSGRVPCLEADGMLIWDSLAIVEYLAERESGVWPLATVPRAWSRSACAEMHSSFFALRNICAMSCGVRVRLHERTPALERDIERMGALWREGINRFGGPFLAGSTFTCGRCLFCAGGIPRAESTVWISAMSAIVYAEMLRKPCPPCANGTMRRWPKPGAKQGHEDRDRWRPARSDGGLRAKAKAGERSLTTSCR